MKEQLKAFFLSFVIHGVLFAILLSVSYSMPPAMKTIVIDFSISSTAGTANAFEKDAGAVSAPEKAVQPKAVKQPKPTPEYPPVTTENNPEIEDTHVAGAAPDISEEQVQVREDPPITTFEDRLNQETVKAPDTEPSTGFSQMAHSRSDDAADEGTASVSEGRPGKKPEWHSGVLTASLDDGSDGVRKGQERYLKEQFAYIRDMVMKSLSYPAVARRMGWEGKVTVSFVVCEGGFAEDIKILRSSGFPVLDRNAVEAIKKASPFPKPPARAQLIMPVVYRFE